MIICHKYKFIFLKTRKTAGSSVEIALSRLCDEKDIVTPIREEELRKKEGGRAGRVVKTSWRRHSLKELIKNTSKFPLPNKQIHKKELFWHHVTASHVKHHIQSRIWNNYLKITIERNPWDKAISRYFWSNKSKDKLAPLSEFLLYLAQEKPWILSDWNIYTINDKIAVDRVIYYEQLTENFDKLVKELGVNDLSLPKQRAKGEFRKDKSHYRELLSQSDADLIRNVCYKEIDAFGYKF